MYDLTRRITHSPFVRDIRDGIADAALTLALFITLLIGVGVGTTIAHLDVVVDQDGRMAVTEVQP